MTLNQQNFEQQLREEGYTEFVLVEQAPGYSRSEHSHPFDAKALIVSGHIHLAVGTKVSSYGEGTVFELAANTPHEEWTDEQGVRYFAGRRPV
jgi:quercetin dioxygenase-like cupin family protein